MLIESPRFLLTNVREIMNFADIFFVFLLFCFVVLFVARFFFILFIVAGNSYYLYTQLYGILTFAFAQLFLVYICCC